MIDRTESTFARKSFATIRLSKIELKLNLKFGIIELHEKNGY